MESGYDTMMSGDAAGIVCAIFAIRELLTEHSTNAALASKNDGLLAFANTHCEADEIRKMILSK